MRYRVHILIMCLMLVLLVLTSCVVEPPEEVITVTATQQSITISSEQLRDYNFSQLFNITVNGQAVGVTADSLTMSNITASGGTGTVTCTYKGQSASVNVTVVLATQFNIVLTVERVSLNISAVADYDFKSLFVYTINGEVATITNDMITSDVKSEVGEYSYVVSKSGISKTLKVIVNEQYNIEIIPSFNTVDLTLEQVADYDFTQLFALYVDGKIQQVTNKMIDSSALLQAEVGKEYIVTMTFAKGSSTVSESVTVAVKAEDQLLITSRNIVTYPNAEPIDLLSLFEIYLGDKQVTVTADMISGNIDYSKGGINNITLSYQGQTQVANVEIRLGVVIHYSSTNVITIIKGANQQTYSFGGDFLVIINGVRFDNIDSYINTDSVDFGVAGEYNATIRIPYNDKSIGLSGGVNFTYYEETVTYMVVDTTFDITIKQEKVTLPKGTASYNEYSNISVRINDRNQALTENADDAENDPIACYVRKRVVVDYDKAGLQHIIIEVYVYGKDNSPILAEYIVEIESGINIVSKDRVVFCGTTLYAKDLFTITESGQPVAVEQDMVSGKIDTFKSGQYFVALSYNNMVATAKVVVLDNGIQGVYRTNLTTIVPNVTSDEEIPEVGVPLSGMSINDNFDIIVDKKVATVISAVDENTINIRIGTINYTLYYNNGIIVLDPDNSIQLAYNNVKRPMIYFQQSLWNIYNKISVNNTSNHVTQSTITCYSIDAFNLHSVNGEDNIWYGLKVNLYEKLGSSSNYKVTWGEVTFNDGFRGAVGERGSALFEGDSYTFDMLSSSVAKIVTVGQDLQFANTTYTGIIDGAPAKLVADPHGGYSLSINSIPIFNLSTGNVAAMVNGGLDIVNKTVHIYDHQTGKYSYKFRLDKERKSFSVVAKDNFWGKYLASNKSIFLDGYGKGIVSFDTKSYYVTPVSYDIFVNELEITYLNTMPNFQYGDHATFYLHPFGNLLTTKYSHNNSLKGLVFKNQQITSGAIVEFDTNVMGKNKNETAAKQSLLEKIQVTCGKDSSYKVDTSKVKFSTAGFYQLAITVTTGNSAVTAYYGLQILDNIYQDHPLVASYGAGILSANVSISINEFGQAVVATASSTYNGNIRINDDNTFIIKATNDTNGAIVVNGVMLSQGLISVRCTGDAVFSDYFTTGVCRTTGNKSQVLREITVNDNRTYIFADSQTALGNIATVVPLNNMSASHDGVILKVSFGVDNTAFVKVISWSNATSGLVASDSVMGRYTSQDNTVLELDGFGNTVNNGIISNYTINSNMTITVYSVSETNIYLLDRVQMTYSVFDIIISNSILSGKTFTAQYAYYCGVTRYVANTSFVFSDSGVLVKSVSADHDGGDYNCESDTYSPLFATAEGVMGTYQVNGCYVTVTVNGCVFKLFINDITTATSLKCVATNLDATSHGYFGVTTVFGIKI